MLIIGDYRIMIRKAIDLLVPQPALYDTPLDLMRANRTHTYSAHASTEVHCAAHKAERKTRESNSVLRVV